jgi:hypothetical protein
MARAKELPAVFRNERVERRLLRMELHAAAFEQRVAVALAELAQAVGNNTCAVTFLARQMQQAADTLPGEIPTTTEYYGRGN